MRFAAIEQLGSWLDKGGLLQLGGVALFSLVAFACGSDATGPSAQGGASGQAGTGEGGKVGQAGASAGVGGQAAAGSNATGGGNNAGSAQGGSAGSAPTFVVGCDSGPSIIAVTR